VTGAGYSAAIAKPQHKFTQVAGTKEIMISHPGRSRNPHPGGQVVTSVLATKSIHIFLAAARITGWQRERNAGFQLTQESAQCAINPLQ